MNDYDISNLNIDSEVTTGSSIDVTPILEKMDTQIEKMDTLISLLIVADIFLVAILIFMAFKNVLKGLWK